MVASELDDLQAREVRDIKPNLFERILASLHQAALDDRCWPEAATRIDQATGAKGNVLMLGEGPCTRAGIAFAQFCFGGENREDWARRYFADYRDRDERIPRFGRLSDCEVVHTQDLFTHRERKTSSLYNEIMREAEMCNGLHVRLAEPEGSYVAWAFADSVSRDGWGADQIEAVKRLLPHVRQFARVRQALVDARALGSSLAALLDSTGCGVIHLDRRGRIVEANDRARDILRQGHLLGGRHASLQSPHRRENVKLQALLRLALPRFGASGESGSISVKRRRGPTPLVVHLAPVGSYVSEQEVSGSRQVAALALIVDPFTPAWVNPDFVAASLNLTPAESRLAASLAAGRTLAEIAAEGGCSMGTIRWHLKRIFRKLGISRQVHLVRRVLALQGFTEPS